MAAKLVSVPLVAPLSEVKTFGGLLQKFAHKSIRTNTQMKFSVFLPPQASPKTPVPALYWLSGLTCTEDNFMQKAEACQYAAKEGIALICPDTSPRGESDEKHEDYVPGQKEGEWDFGTGAGFYVTATEGEYAKNYNMYQYVTDELVELCQSELPITKVKSITGHSMGGHGALVCFLRNPGAYQSVSAFAPISNPINCPWGQKAFTGYLGTDKETWKQYDATELVKNYKGEEKTEILIDQGAADKFYTEKQLLTENFAAAAKENSTVTATIRMQEGYDHSIDGFVKAFIGDHIAHHAKFLKK